LKNLRDIHATVLKLFSPVQLRLNEVQMNFSCPLKILDCGVSWGYSPAILTNHNFIKNQRPMMLQGFEIFHIIIGLKNSHVN
jgi:hypothetical protein